MANPQVTFEELRRSARHTLRTAGIESADIDVKILMREAFGLGASDLIVNAQHQVPFVGQSQFHAMLDRRLKHEPIAYITGKQPFWTLDFKVSPGVLIPRPETEGVVERALSLIAEVDNPVIADVGTGSGAIVLSLLSERKDASAIGLDISAKGLEIAKLNAIQFGIADRVKFIKSDYLSALKERVNIVVSNPPYVTDKAMGELPTTVVKFEPDLALRGGGDGLVAYKCIIDDLARVLLPSGIVVFEIGYDQGASVESLLARNGFENIRVDKDLAGLDRVVSGKLSA
jgi:release factor glutamine methyltransferase